MPVVLGNRRESQERLEASWGPGRLSPGHVLLTCGAETGPVAMSCVCPTAKGLERGAPISWCCQPRHHQEAKLQSEKQTHTAAARLGAGVAGARRTQGAMSSGELYLGLRATPSPGAPGHSAGKVLSCVCSVAVVWGPKVVWKVPKKGGGGTHLTD